MRQSPCTVRAMSRHELGVAVDWAAREGWNPGLHDAETYYAADPGGFFIGLVETEPVATLSAVRYGESYGFIGFFIVKPGCRGRGYGRRIWQAGLAHLAGRTIGLDGVVEQQANYQKSGFVTAHRNIRYGGTGRGRDASTPAAAIVALAQVPFAEVCAYDRPFFPEDRSEFLRAWLAQPGAAALGARGENGGLAGYAVARPCRTGFKFGPLFADSPQVAEELFCALQARVPEGAAIFFDVPEVNGPARDLARRYHMTMCFETARMYAGGCPELPLGRMFGITSFEVG